MPYDMSYSPDDYDEPQAYAHAMAVAASRDAGGVEIGCDPGFSIKRFAIEAMPGGVAHNCEDLTDAIEDLPDYRDGARVIVRTVTYGPWRYATPDEIGTP